ncbi:MULTISPECIES: TetR/AcrR family transcriptional regulator [Pedobacter]|uniref:TetR/AcrR family transcriptional regulator n=2 Tax=Pedobacter agri TaxID=454586 RepID=A0A9X3D9L7_9SPHI|nr:MULTISPECIES: TetR/AcrR family transcriptional regulator [Pedobacter]AZI26314.1 TetR/AcrR family transcriptional regulator [Pedobacter sp. G11]MCX3263150.1 TetR/AcrR family transcriptional regulator [Pedobacter agri]RYD80730.1 MAG: TetR/AcrR family transcriptional regulator [Sphingobacteriales bacterium]
MARTKVFNEAEVLDRAMNLFWEKGYHATSAQDLVDGLGISRSSLYDTYGDKHSLFVMALKRYREERIDPVIQGVNSADDIEAYIRFIFEAVKEDALSESRSRGCFMVNSAVELGTVDRDVAAIANDIMKDTEDMITKAIEKGQQRGVFTKTHSASSLSRFIFNSLNGLRVTMKFDASKKMFEDIVNVCLASLKA